MKKIVKRSKNCQEESSYKSSKDLSRNLAKIFRRMSSREDLQKRSSSDLILQKIILTKDLGHWKDVDWVLGKDLKLEFLRTLQRFIWVYVFYFWLLVPSVFGAIKLIISWSVAVCSIGHARKFLIHVLGQKIRKPRLLGEFVPKKVPF